MPKSRIDYDALERMSDAELKHFIAEYSRGDEDALHCIFMLEEAIAAGEQRAEAFRDRCNTIARKQNEDFARALEAGDPEAVALWAEVQAHYEEGNMTPGEREFILTQTSPEESDIENFLQFVLGGPDMVRDLLETLTPTKVKKVLPGRELNPQEEEALRYTDRERAALRSGSDEEKTEARKARRERSRRFLSGLTVEDFAEIAKDYAKEKERQEKKPAEQKRDKFSMWTSAKNDFLIVPRPRGMEELININRIGSAAIKQKETGTIKVKISDRLSLDEQKISEMFRIAFLRQNPHKATKNLDRKVIIPFTQTMEYLGRSVTPDNRKKFNQQLNNSILSNISHTYIEVKYANGDWIHMEVGAGTFRAYPSKDEIHFTLNEDYAKYINTGAQRQFNRKALELGTRQKPLPYYLYQKLADQYFSDINRQRGTNNILSIRTILKYCSDTIPSYEYIKETDRGRWKKRIKDPLEEALNEIKEKQLFKWEYCKQQLGEVAEEELKGQDFDEWTKLYITFQLIPEEPDQAERLEHKRQRIEDAKATKAVKDAEAIIEADKIKKRNDRKKGRKKAAINA